MSNKGPYDWEKDKEYNRMLGEEGEREDSDASPPGKTDDDPDRSAADDRDDTILWSPAGKKAPAELEDIPAPAEHADVPPPDPSLNFDDDALDEDYRAVLDSIAAQRRGGYQAVPVDEEEEQAYSQYAAPTKNERADGFQVNIDDESFASLEELERAEAIAPSEESEPVEAGPEPPLPPRRPKKRKRFLLLKALIFAAIVIGISVYLSGIILNSVYDLFGLMKEDIEIEVDIPQGASVQEIADLLAEKGVISEPLVFRAYSRLKGADDTYQYGTYTLNAKMSYDEIILELQELVPRKDVVTVTIPEGLTAYEIAQLLEENEVCEADAFIDLVRSGDIRHSLVDEMPKEKYRYYTLEGYLFPDTYDFYIGEAVGSVVRKFLDNFEAKYKDSLALAMYDTTMTLDQVLTLASIIQAEASDTSQMNMVSSVFHNRLDMPEVYPQLQSDVTIFYVTDNILPLLDVQDDGYYAAYSTYICTGLPIGPVCNPGLAAIRAAIYPSNSDYYYFLTDTEGNYYYASTDEEHERNKQAVGIES